MLAEPPSDFLIASTTMRAWGWTMGLPAASFLIPGAAAMMATAERGMLLIYSEDALPERIMARSGVEVLPAILTTPWPIDSSEIITATTLATPMTVTRDVPTRCGRLRMFIAVMAPI